MPEGPEVEVQRRALRSSGAVKRRTLLDAQYTFKLRSPIPDLTVLNGARLTQVRRRGKYLGFTFDNGLYLISHLGMTGSWRIIEGKRKPEDYELKHQHVVLRFPDPYGSKSADIRWVYTDPRRFGSLAILNEEELKVFSANLGKDPTRDVDPKWLRLRLKGYGKTWSIKQFLLDQHNLTGLGNIYCSEVLNKCQINPETKAYLLYDRAEDILKFSNWTLAQAVLLGGSSIHSYTDPLGQTGRMQNHYVAYNRENSLCVQCQEGTIAKMTGKDGRTSYYCPNCQVIQEP